MVLGQVHYCWAFMQNENGIPISLEHIKNTNKQLVFGYGRNRTFRRRKLLFLEHFIKLTRGSDTENVLYIKCHRK